MNRGYVSVSGRRVHLFAAGRGFPIVLLQDVPLRAVDLRPLGEELAETNAVIVPDLPGCGLSEPLRSAGSDADSVARHLEEVIDALGVRDFVLYARGSASLIALRMGERLGQRIPQILLDDPRVFLPDEAPGWMGWFAEDFQAEPSGAHLIRLWDRLRTECQFEPPFRLRAANRRLTAMPVPAELTNRLLGWMSADAEVRELQLSLAAEPKPRLVGVRRVEQLNHHSGGKESVHRTAGLVRIQLRRDLPGADVDLRTWSPPPRGGTRFSRLFIKVDGGYLHAHVSLKGKRRPLVVLHDPAGTSELVLPFAVPLSEDRPIIAVDLPGNGESDNVLATEIPNSATYAGVLADMLDSLGLSDIDLLGRYSGGPIGMELAFLCPGRIRHLVQAGITTYGATEAQRLLARYTPSIRPRADGTHLLKAWHIMKSQALFWPWFDQSRRGVIRGEPQIDPALIHRRVIDLLKCGDLYRKAYAALWTYPLAERLPRLDVPTLLCAPDWDPLYPHLGKAAAAGPQCAVEKLPPQFADWHKVLIPFLDDCCPVDAWASRGGAS